LNVDSAFLFILEEENQSESLSTTIKTKINQMAKAIVNKLEVKETVNQTTERISSHRDQENELG